MLPSQFCDEFEKFISNLNLILEALTHKNPFLAIIIGDFNER